MSMQIHFIINNIFLYDSIILHLKIVLVASMLHGIEENNISFAVVDGLAFVNAQFCNVHFQNLN